MPKQDNSDISHIQVPDTFIQEILEQTQPLKEDREEVHPPQKEAQTSEGGKVVELLSLMFEEFDKLNARMDVLQTSIKEMTGTGTGSIGTGYSHNKSCTPAYSEKDVQAELEGRKRPKKSKANEALTQLLMKRMGR